MRRRWKAALVVAAAALAASIWGFAVEPASLRNEDYEISIPRWPSSCDGLRVAFLTDLHVGSPFNRIGKLDRIIDLTREARPQIVLLGGDFVIQGVVGGQATTPEAIASRLRRLAAPLGVWAVLGNHDWWLDGPRVARALESAGIRVLDDAAAPVRSGPCAFSLVGISDFMERPHDVRAALADVADDVSVLAFTHNPDVFPDVPPRVSLTIAGHTHGGQVSLPFIGRPIVPSRYGQRYAVGHVVEGGRHLFVSTGLGTSILPVRVRVPPEVSVITLRSDARDTTGLSP